MPSASASLRMDSASRPSSSMIDRALAAISAAVHQSGSWHVHLLFARLPRYMLTALALEETHGFHAEHRRKRGARLGAHLRPQGGHAARTRGPAPGTRRPAGADPRGAARAAAQGQGGRLLGRADPGRVRRHGPVGGDDRADRGRAGPLVRAVRLRRQRRQHPLLRPTRSRSSATCCRPSLASASPASRSPNRAPARTPRRSGRPPCATATSG